MFRVTALATALVVTAAPAVRADPPDDAAEEPEEAADAEAAPPRDGGEDAADHEEATDQAPVEDASAEEAAGADASAGEAAAAPAARSEAPAKPIALTPEDVQTFADATLDATPLHFAFNAFGDVSVTGRAVADGDESATFSLGTFALLINGELGKTLLGTAEMAFDAGEDNEQEVTLERLHLGWRGEHLYVVAGRTHSDIGYWNTAFHHGAWLHLPIARPRALRGEKAGGILPVHWIGAEGGARLPLGPGTFTLAGGIGNGRGRDQESIPLRRDTNDFKALKVKMEYLGVLLPDLRVGAGGLYDPIAPEPTEVRPALPDQQIDEYIADGYLAYRGVNLTLVAEGYSIWHVAEPQTFLTTDAFVVLGYRFGRVTPYVQVERTDSHGDPDPFYTPVPDMPTASTPIDATEVLAGARVDASVWSALKLEYRMTRRDAVGEPDHSLALNWSFGI